MSALDFALIAFLVLTFLNYWVRHSILYPPFIFCFMWLLDVTIYRLNVIDVDPVHGNTLAIVVGGAVLFSIGGLFATFTPRSLLRIRFTPRRSGQQSDFVRNVLMLVLICGLPIFFYQVLQISNSGTGSGFLAKARQAQVEAAENGAQIRSFVLDYFLVISLFVSLLFATGKKDWKFWVATGIAFTGCILSTGRTSLLLLISALSAIQLIQIKQESFGRALKVLRWPVALFFTMYILLIFVNKNTEDLVGGVFGIAVYYVFSYIVGPLAAFDVVVQNPNDFVQNTSHTFEFPLRLASTLHLVQYEALAKLDTFVLVPFPTNVYTVFKFYFLEVGIGGTLLFMFIFGALQTLLYLKAKEGSRFAMYLFAFSIYSVLMVIFDDSYYALGVYVRAFAFGYVYFGLCSLPFQVFPSRQLSTNSFKSSIIS